MARLYLQYNIERLLTWPEVRDAGGIAAFATSTQIGGVDVKTSFLSTVTGGFNLVRLTGVAPKLPSGAEQGFSSEPVGTTYWTYTPITVADDYRIPNEYLVAGGGGVVVPPTGTGQIDPTTPHKVESDFASLQWSSALFATAKDVLASHLKSEFKAVVGLTLAGKVPAAFGQSVLDVGEVGFRLNAVGTALTKDYSYLVTNFDSISAQEAQTLVSSSYFYAHGQFSAGFASIASQYYGQYGVGYYSQIANSIKTSLILISPQKDGSDQFTIVSGVSRTMHSDKSDIMLNYEGSNNLKAGLGDDLLVSGAMNDTYIDEGGNDRFAAGEGIDTAVFAVDRSSARVQRDDKAATIQHSGSIDRTFDVERLQFNDGYIGLDIDGVSGKAFRLYQAAFDRTPDQQGLGYWIRQMDAGKLHLDVADNFIGSAEFIRAYGTSNTITNDRFVDLLYQNILGRSAEQDGQNFWTGQLASGVTRKEVLAFFAESNENLALVAVSIADGVWYY